MSIDWQGLNIHFTKPHSLATIQMLDTVLSYEDWRDFFTKQLINTGRFYLLNTLSKGDTDVEIYSALKGNPNTFIEVGYFSSMTLIYIHIFNPETPGKNRQQEIEHFYKYEFNSEKQYGPPGLDFNEININGISNYLNQGFNGKESVYYKKGRLIKSRLTTSYYPGSPQSTMTYHFNVEPLYKRFLKKFLGRSTEYDEIRHIDLQNVFSGLNGG